MKCWLCDEDFEPDDLNEQGLCEDCQHDQENEQDYDGITDYEDGEGPFQNSMLTATNTMNHQRNL